MRKAGMRCLWSVLAAGLVFGISGCGEGGGGDQAGRSGDSAGAPAATVKLETPQAAIDAMAKALPTGDIDAIMKLYTSETKAKMSGFRAEKGDAEMKKMMAESIEGMKSAKPGDLKVDGDKATQEFAVNDTLTIKISVAKEGDEWRVSKVLQSHTMGKSSAPKGATPASDAPAADAPKVDAPAATQGQ